MAKHFFLRICCLNVAAIFMTYSPINLFCDDYSSKNPFATPYKATSFAKEAESELKRGTQASLKKGISLLEAAISDRSFLRLDSETRAEIVLTLANAYKTQGQFQAQMNLLKNAIKNKSHRSFWILLKAELADSYLSQDELQEAELLLQELKSLSLNELNFKEQEAIITLADKIERHWEGRLLQAEKLWQSHHFQEAGLFWRQVLGAVERKSFPNTFSEQSRNELLCELQFRTAESYYLAHDFQNAFSLMSSRQPLLHSYSKQLRNLWQDGLFLQGLAAVGLKQWQQGLDLFELYLSQKTEEPPFLLQASYQSALCALQSRNFAKAHFHLQLPLQESKESDLTKKAILLLAALEIEEETLDLARTHLDELQNELLTCQPLFYECLYYKGKLSLLQNNFEQAALFLEQAIPGHLRDGFDWTNATLSLLGHTYLSLAQKTKTYSLLEREVFFDRSQTCFEELILQTTGENEEAAILGLAQNFALRFLETNDVEWQKKAENLLATNLHIQSQKGKFEANLLLTALIGDFQDRQKHYDLYIKEASFDNLLTIKGLYLSSINDLEKSKNEPDIKQKILDKVIKNSTIAFEQEKKLSENLLPVRFAVAKALLDQQQTSGTSLACSLLEEAALVQTNKNRSRAQKEEALFLLALAYTQKASFDKKAASYKLANETIHQFFSCFPHSPYVGHALHLLGYLYQLQNEDAKALDVWQTIIADYADYSNLDEVLFLAAESLEARHQQVELVTNYRKQLYKNFETSPRAPVSFFRLFPESEYLEGSYHAIQHLKKMPQAFENSPFAVASYFYVGMRLKQEGMQKKLSEEHTALLEESVFNFEKTISLYSKLKRENAISDSIKLPLQSIYFQAELLRAKNLSQLALAGKQSTASYELCQEGLKKLMQSLEFEIANLQEKSEVPPYIAHFFSTWQEASLRRSRALEMLGREQDAIEELHHLVTFAKSMKMQEGENVARAYCDLASFHAREGKFNEAHELLLQAERVQAKGLARELLLEIWIAKSHCFRRMQQLDIAMTLLSQVINDDCASSLRVQAMFLRAEIYELQHRRDLAMKQLEATAKKGGEWGGLASHKLEEIYGFE